MTKIERELRTYSRKIDPHAGFDMIMNQLQRPLKYLRCPRDTHRLDGRESEQGQEVMWRTGLIPVQQVAVRLVGDELDQVRRERVRAAVLRGAADGAQEGRSRGARGGRRGGSAARGGGARVHACMYVWLCVCLFVCWFVCSIRC